jgi:hypothetical protein
MAKTAKSTRGQTISILEIYPEDIAEALLPGDVELLKEKYGDGPCQYEVRFPWKDHMHYTWFVDDVYEKYSKTHKIIRRKR